MELWFAQDTGVVKRMGEGRSFHSRRPWIHGQARSRCEKADLKPPLLLGLPLGWAAAAGLMALPLGRLQMLCSGRANGQWGLRHQQSVSLGGPKHQIYPPVTGPDVDLERAPVPIPELCCAP